MKSACSVRAFQSMPRFRNSSRLVARSRAPPSQPPLVAVVLAMPPT
jgi:hypothetical protein